MRKLWKKGSKWKRKTAGFVAIIGGQNLKFIFVRIAAKKYISDIKKGGKGVYIPFAPGAERGLNCMKCYCCHCELTEGTARRGAWIAASDFTGKHFICDACDEKLKVLLTKGRTGRKRNNEK